MDRFATFRVMDSNVSISFYGTPDRLHFMREHSESLKDTYNLKFEQAERHYHADGQQMGDPFDSHLSINVVVQNSFLGYLGSYLVKKGFEYIFKSAIFEPLCNWLESIDTNEEIPPADELTFLYDDISVRIAYAKKNHQNAVGMVTLQLVKLVPHLRMEGLGDLTTVATPVKHFGNEWRFYTPEKEFLLSDYMKTWGLIFNNMNKCVMQVKPPQLIHQHWW